VILITGLVLAIFVVPDAWRIPTVIGFAVLEVVETTVTWRLSQRWRPKVGVETLLGAHGRTVTPCRPEGRVRVRGEDWRARSEAGVDADSPVRVVERRGATLLVEPVTE
jgi:membrane-bound ClpP family serine protease